MDLAGLLVDEEGAFSLTGFQDFTVSWPGPPPLRFLVLLELGDPLFRLPGSERGSRASLGVGTAGWQALQPCLLEALAAWALRDSYGVQEWGLG